MDLDETVNDLLSLNDRLLHLIFTLHKPVSTAVTEFPVSSSLATKVNENYR